MKTEFSKKHALKNKEMAFKNEVITTLAAAYNVVEISTNTTNFNNFCKAKSINIIYVRVLQRLLKILVGLRMTCLFP